MIKFFKKGQAYSAEYSPGELKWADYSKITGKRIIAGCGNDADGSALTNCDTWSLENKKARINDGVIGLSSSMKSVANLDRLNL